MVVGAKLCTRKLITHCLWPFHALGQYYLETIPNRRKQIISQNLLCLSSATNPCRGGQWVEIIALLATSTLSKWGVEDFGDHQGENSKDHLARVFWGKFSGYPSRSLPLMEVDRRSVLHSTADQYAEVDLLVLPCLAFNPFLDLLAFPFLALQILPLCPRLPQCTVCGTFSRSVSHRRIGFCGRRQCFLECCFLAPWLCRWG